MPKGIFLVEWNKISGWVVEASFPISISLDSELISQYITKIPSLHESPIIQIQDKLQNTLIYGIASHIQIKKDSEIHYTLIILQLDEKKSKRITGYEILLSAEGKTIVTAPPQERKGLFLQFARKLFRSLTHKVVFLGFPNAGKTSTKLILFEKIRDNHLLETTLEPTMGVETFSYNLLDLNISFFDTAGQELDRWFEETEDILRGANLIIFFFAVSDWQQNAQEVKTYLEKLIRQESIQKSNDSKVIAFCHKVDLLTEKDRSLKEEIIQFTDQQNLLIFFTSILNGGNGDLWRALQVMLENFSQSLKAIRNCLNSLFQLFKFQPLFLMDSEGRIIANYYINEDQINKTIQQVSRFFPNVADVFNEAFQQPVEILVFSIPNTNDFIICLDCSRLSSEFGYIFLLGTSLAELKNFYGAYAELVKSLKWKQE